MKVSKDMKFHIINLILKVSLLPQKNKEKLQIVERAQAALEQIKVSMKPEEQEWLSDLEETLVKNETVQFFNMDKPVSNKMLLEAL